MTILPELLKFLHEIPEKMIEEAAEHVGGVNAFQELLIKGAIFRAANTTPIYLANDEQTLMLVTCEETIGKRLH